MRDFQLKAKRNKKHVLPKKWWNSTNNSPNPCIDWVNLLQGSVDKCIKYQIGSCQPSRQHISLQQPCHRSRNISHSAQSQVNETTSQFQYQISYTKRGERIYLVTLLANKAVPAKPTEDAQVTAWGMVMRPEGRGLSLVLFILASFFISNT